VPEHFEALKKLYVEYKHAAQSVAKALADEEYNEAQNIIRRKGEILRNIVNQENIVEYTDDMRLEQSAIKNEIAQIEKTNLENLKTARDKTSEELKKVRKDTTLHKAYSLGIENSGDIVNTLE